MLCDLKPNQQYFQFNDIILKTWNLIECFILKIRFRFNCSTGVAGNFSTDNSIIIYLQQITNHKPSQTFLMEGRYRCNFSGAERRILLGKNLQELIEKQTWNLVSGSNDDDLVKGDIVTLSPAPRSLEWGQLC